VPVCASDGGVATGAESSELLSELTLSRAGRAGLRREKKRRDLADLGGGVGGASSSFMGNVRVGVDVLACETDV